MRNVVRVAAVGDVMLGDHPVCFGHGVRSTARRLGVSTLLANALPLLREHDLLIGNLECVLSDFNHDERRISSSELRGDPEFADSLNICDFTVFSVANNHMLQHGTEAFQETCANLIRNDISPIGLWEDGFSKVVLREIRGVKLALLAYSFRPEHFCKENSFYAQASKERVIEQICRIRVDHPDHIVILSLHWGEEYLTTPSAEQVQWAHDFVEAGASLIVGHHPHVLQGFERYKGALIAYSLGNFLFDSWQQETRESVILSCEISTDGVIKHEVLPVFISDDFRLSLDHPATREISEKVQELTRILSEGRGLLALSTEEYQDRSAKRYFQYRLECYLYFLSRFWKYTPRVFMSSLFRSILRRIGFA